MRNALEQSHPPLPSLAVRASVARDADAFVMSLRVCSGGATFERTLRDPSCEVLASSAAFLIRLGVTQLTDTRQSGDAPSHGRRRARKASEHQDGDARADAVTALPPNQPSSETFSHGAEPALASDASLASDVGSSPASPLMAASEPWHAAAGLAAGVSDLGFGGLSPEASLDFLARFAHLDAGVRFGATFHPALDVSSAEVSFRTLYTLLSVCAAWGSSTFRTGPCAVVDGLLTLVDGNGLVGARASSALWASGGGAFRVAVELHPKLRFTFEAMLTLALSARPSFEVSGVSIARGNSTAASARVGVSVDVW